MKDWDKEEKDNTQDVETIRLAEQISALCHNTPAPVVLQALYMIIEDLLAQSIEQFPEQQDNIINIMNVGHDHIVNKYSTPKSGI